MNIKVNIVLMHCMKAYDRVEVQLQLFLTLILDGGEQSAPCLTTITMWKAPQYPLKRRHGGPQA